ncbi:alpha-ketoglutarate dehydrogenase component 4 [Musca vetustissima]|uniref:alpha-ketoglutarate dehydrogenase component 4 n=1 Tax=Musca vetustissima TaxID=27455 RepID=UPI002AB6B037|nr:alpha-ketoglutarate dehydrogenase component 4 [Musca vetustissima]
MVLRTAIVQSAKRIPLIKFRKGGYPGLTAAGAQASSFPNTLESKNNPAVLEDWELPPRYWRKPISVDEMEYINRGGPA